MSISVNACLLLTKIFPYKKAMGRESAEEYVKVQMKWAEQSFQKFGKYIDLKDKKLLDAGCGTGGKTYFYSQKGVSSVTGVDLNPNSIEVAIKSFGHVPNIEYYAASVADLPFADNSFDYVILNDVVEHIERPILEAALKELMRVVKPEGRILLEFPPWSSHDAAHLYDFISIPWCQFFFSDETLKTVVRKIATEKGVANERIEKLLKVHDELNKITISESYQMFKKLNFKIVRFDKWVFFNFKLLQYIPFFNKYVTKRVFTILSK